MVRRLVYSKHAPSQNCGVAFFSEQLARRLDARHVHGFHGFSRCDEFYINIDLLELQEGEAVSLLNFIRQGGAQRVVLILHDYHFTCLEGELIKASDLVVNLSCEDIGEPHQTNIIDLFSPPLTETPLFSLANTGPRPLTLAFGFFSPRKKSFSSYVGFYQHMLTHFPQWGHVVVASAHEGDATADPKALSRMFSSSSMIFLEFMPNVMLTELVGIAELGVCFYPSGVMRNNAVPMSFFAQGKPVITNYGDSTPEVYFDFTLDMQKFDRIDFSQRDHLRSLGARAKAYYQDNWTWDIFIEGIVKQPDVCSGPSRP